MKCKICSKKTKHLESHHIIPKSRGGNDNKSNLIKICSECHGLAHDVSFINERGGLIKEGVKKSKENHKNAVIWLEENDSLVHEKMMDLYDKDEDTYMLMMLLLENDKMSTSNLKEWYETGTVSFKTMFTI